jgi:hypothetical protein
LAENIATVVDWYGPFARGEDAAVAKSWGTRGLYAAVGHKIAGTRGPRRLLYVGISENLGRRLTAPHHKLSGLSGVNIWLGDVSVPGIPGRRAGKTNPHLDSAEWALVRFLRPPENQKKSFGMPASSCLVLNRWWDYREDWHEIQAVARPSAGWADIIEYDSYRGTANLIWLGAKARVKPVKFQAATTT